MARPEIMLWVENGCWKGAGALKRWGHEGRSRCGDECPVQFGLFRCPGETPPCPAGAHRRDGVGGHVHGGTR